MIIQLLGGIFDGTETDVKNQLKNIAIPITPKNLEYETLGSTITLMPIKWWAIYEQVPNNPCRYRYKMTKRDGEFKPVTKSVKEKS